jgi:hypothetical protein
MRDYGLDTSVSQEAATTNFNLKSCPARQRLSFNAFFSPPHFHLTSKLKQSDKLVSKHVMVKECGLSCQYQGTASSKVLRCPVCRDVSLAQQVYSRLHNAIITMFTASTKVAHFFSSPYIIPGTEMTGQYCHTRLTNSHFLHAVIC